MCESDCDRESATCSASLAVRSAPESLDRAQVSVTGVTSASAVGSAAGGDVCCVVWASVVRSLRGARLVFVLPDAPGDVTGNGKNAPGPLLLGAPVPMAP